LLLLNANLLTIVATQVEIGQEIARSTPRLGAQARVSVRLPLDDSGEVPKKDFDVDFVNNNPSAFSDAFFEFSWIKVYQ